MNGDLPPGLVSAAGATPVRHLFSIRAIAAMLDVNPETIRRAIRAGRLGCYRLHGSVRIADHHLQAYIEASECPARDRNAPSSDSTEEATPSSGGMEQNVADSQLERRMKHALDKPSRISKPKLKLIPSD